MRSIAEAMRLAVPFMLLGLTGCFSLSRTAPPVQHFVLGERRTPAAVVPVGDPPPPLVGLRALGIADYLTTPFIVVRRGSNRIEFSEFHRWGEDLAWGIGHAVADYMAAQEPSRRVEAAPWPSGVRPEYVIRLNVLHFEGVAPEDPADLEGEAWLFVTWDVGRARDGAVLASGTTELRSSGWSVGDYDDLVRLLDAGLWALSEELVGGLGVAAVP